MSSFEKWSGTAGTGSGPVNWRKSARCAGNAACVEVGALAGAVGARDAFHGDASPVLTFSAAEWRAFTDRVKEGRFDPAR